MGILHFLRDRRGSIAPTFALLTFPIVGLVGAAVDYSRANNAQTSLQAAVDATALAMAQKAPSVTAAQLQTSANGYFNAVFNRPEVKNAVIGVNYTTTSGSKVTANGTATVPTVFMGLFGVKSIPIAANSTVAWGMSRLRVALVLDNTGSMADSGKMTALKTAAHNLLNQLQTAAQNSGDVYVSIIPFTTDVNIGTGFANQPWIDWSNYSPYGSVENGLTCSSGSSGWGGFGFGGFGWGTQCGASNTSQWNGCVMDRNQDYDVSNAAPVTSNANTYFPADQSAWCPTQMLPLTNNWTALSNEIDAMQPNGDTNQTIGLAWGWQSLSTTSPLNAPAMDPNYQYQQVIILLTDGMNTQNRWTYTQSDVDARTQKACNNIKAAGISIWTVLVLAGDSTLLQNCASSPNQYFALSSSNQIITTFQTIGTNLSQLRIAK